MNKNENEQKLSRPPVVVLNPIEVQNGVRYQNNDEQIGAFWVIGAVVLAILGFGQVFDYVGRFVHHPVEGLHVQLRLQLFADFRSDFRVVIVEQAFLKIEAQTIISLSPSARIRIAFTSAALSKFLSINFGS